jgi:hypothetical protein
MSRQALSVRRFDIMGHSTIYLSRHVNYTHTLGVDKFE